MGVRGKTPGMGDPIGSWSHDKVQGGKERSGWLAGDVHVIQCHSSRASKPCRKHYLNNDADCAGCAHGIPVKELGYVPLWRWDGTPTIVVIQDHHTEQVGNLDLHTHVFWGRAEGLGEGVYIKPSNLPRKWESTIREKMMPVDITRGCCVLFGMLDLEQILRRAIWGVDIPLSTTRALKPKEARDEINDIRKDAGNRIKDVVKRSFTVKEQDPAPLSDLLPGLAKHARNGKA
jgi:hypothetical protein